MTRRVEAWAWAVEADDSCDGPWFTWDGEDAARDKMLDLAESAKDCGEPVPKMRVVKLVPHDPAAAAVVRAAVRFYRVNRETMPADWEPEGGVMRAVERLQERRGKR